MDFIESCSEVNFILEHLNPNDRKNIPETVFDFFRENKSIFYKVELDYNKPLTEQKLKDETKVFLQILYYKYFASETQKEKIRNMEDILVDDDTFSEEKSKESTDLIVYQENKFTKILKKIKEFFRTVQNKIEKDKVEK